MKLSKHFTLGEFTESATAVRKNIPNIPSEAVIHKLKILCEKVLEPLRESQGVPIFISSGYRSKALNKAIGGAPTSQHTKGEAVDIKTQDMRASFMWILERGAYDQLIWEFGDTNQPSWIHVSYNEGSNRRQVLVASKIDGKTMYKEHKFF